MTVTHAVVPSAAVPRAVFCTETTLQMTNGRHILGSAWVLSGADRHFVTCSPNRFEELAPQPVAFASPSLTMKVEQPETSHPAGAPSGVLGSMRKIT